MKIPNVTIQQLLEAGVHLGHKTLRWNPKMKKYIFGKRDSIHIIDLTQTLDLTKIALEKIFKTIESNGKILFVSSESVIVSPAQKVVMPETVLISGSLTTTLVSLLNSPTHPFKTDAAKYVLLCPKTVLSARGLPPAATLYQTTFGTLKSATVAPLHTTVNGSRLGFVVLSFTVSVKSCVSVVQA